MTYQETQRGAGGMILADPMPPLAGPDEAAALHAGHPSATHFDALFVDICGRMRGKRYPIAELAKIAAAGMQIPETIYLLDVTGAMSDPCGRGFADGDPDGHAFPLAGRIAPQLWTEGTRLQALMTMAGPDGRPSRVEPRNVLREILARFEPIGLTPVVAIELEFYLIEIARGAGGAPIVAEDKIGGGRVSTGNVYEMRELDRYAKILAGIERAAHAQGVPATAASSEYSAGQFEINLEHRADAAAAADDAALLRHAIISLARSEGRDATFLPKPWMDRAGSGMHVHLSLIDRDGRNIFDDGSAVGTSALRHAIGGLQNVMGDAMAIFASNINAYRRYVPDLFVPVNRHWGLNNRSVGLRVPAGAPEARRIEHRVAGADANPYLVLAAILAGVHHGLTHGPDPGAPFAGNASGRPDPTLPMTLPEALMALQSSALMRDYFSGEYIDLYTEQKRGELKTFMGAISPQEYEWYL